MIKNKKKEVKRLQKRVKSGTTNKSKVSTKKATFLIKPKSLKNNSLNYIKKHKEKEKEKDKLL